MKQLNDLGVKTLKEALENIKKGGFTAFFSHRSTEGRRQDDYSGRPGWWRSKSHQGCQKK